MYLSVPPLTKLFPHRCSCIPGVPHHQGGKLERGSSQATDPQTPLGNKNRQEG